MKRYQIRISVIAHKDIENLRFIITEIFKSPKTAKIYIEEIRKEITILSASAESYPVSTLISVLKYGHNARRMNHKKMAIIYTIHDNIVLIHRVVPGSILSE